MILKLLNRMIGISRMCLSNILNAAIFYQIMDHFFVKLDDKTSDTCMGFTSVKEFMFIFYIDKRICI